MSSPAAKDGLQATPPQRPESYPKDDLPPTTYPPDRIAAPGTPELTGQRAHHVQTDSHANNKGNIHDSISSSPRRFMRRPNSDKSLGESPLQLQMPFVTPGQLAFSAMKFLPIPVLILNSLKTVVLANEAMGRLLGLISESQEYEDGEDATEVLEELKGQSLSQVGIDMLQDGKVVWVAWDNFFDSLVDDVDESTQGRRSLSRSYPPDGQRGDTTPTADRDSSERNKVPNHYQQTVVEVVVSRKDLMRKAMVNPRLTTKNTENQIFAKMIINIWEIADHQTYFTLTFTNTESAAQVGSTKRPVARFSNIESADKKTISTTSNPPSVASSHGSSSSPSLRLSPNSISLSSTPFPPMGPPFKSLQSAPSVLQKMMIIKDALLDNTETPIIAMWKDCTIAYPNAACRRLMSKDASTDSSSDGFDILKNWVCYTEDFSRVLDYDEYPISVLLRTQQPYSGMRVGIIDQEDKRIVLDILAETIRDEETGEFLAGVVTCRDVTKMSAEIDQIKRMDAERFRVICDSMPQLVWTTDPVGSLDFFNTRWTEFTGMTLAESLGVYNWTKCFHPDDMIETRNRWEHSLRTGDPYSVEYRCQTKEGEWRWLLGRAMPLRNPTTGKIEKWFGTCTDVHENIETRLAARRTRQQLLSVIAHAHVTIFTVDLDRKVTMLEGALIENSQQHQDSSNGTGWGVGQDVDVVFNRLHPELPEGQRPNFLTAIDSIIDRKTADYLVEHSINGRHFRTRFLPMTLKKNNKDDAKPAGDDELQVPVERQGGSSENDIEGVIGIIMDVTEVKAKEAVLEAQAKEKQQLLANEAAAKEASRLKSQFLANMSHEIRTPITGVIGMAELLLTVQLEEEAREYAENIFRSANALLTVINDILDFSKVESGRLDIEEVQFSMSVIVRDVAKMLSFAAQRKNLQFISDISPDIAHDLVVLGDPGRIRQIITNLLTNSIKFTHQGFVKLSVTRESETDDTIEVRFSVQDTGIGIDEVIRKRLFQPFSQGDASTARKFGGTGLGLTICKSLLELMHGRITLDSVVDQGTTATFWVPFNKPQNTQPANLVQIQAALPDRLQSEMSVSCNSSEFDALGTPPGEMLSLVGSTGGASPVEKGSKLRGAIIPDEVELTKEQRENIHVLVVEDNAINQQIATKTIKKLGFNVSAVWNGREALDYLAGAKEGKNRKPEIILMDVQMPICDGYKATHLLRHHVPYKAFIRDVPIVAMTASAIQGDQEKCKRAGMDDYLSKPVKSKTLEKMLVRWSLNRRPTSARSAATGAHSAFSDCCSEGSEDCSIAGIPCVGMEDGEEEAPQLGVVNHAGDDGMLNAEAAADLLTPRPKASPKNSYLGVPVSGTTPPSSMAPGPATEQAPSIETGSSRSAPPDNVHIRRVETDEMAQQSRDDKLIDAADGGRGKTSGVNPLGHHHGTPMSEKGDSLTEANVEKFRREELRRRMS